MLYAEGNLFTIDCDAMCITTNGFVKRNGQAVMGKGCALELTHYDDDATSYLGSKINSNGNIVQMFMMLGETPVVSFPVKPTRGYAGVPLKFPPPKSATNDTWDIVIPNGVVKHLRHKMRNSITVPGWACTAILEIIERSAHQLVELADEKGWNNVVLPYAGCGAGELNWQDEVKPMLASILDDRFTAVTFPRKRG